MLRFLPAIVLLLAACGNTAVVAQKASHDVSYADIQPAAGITYPEFRNHRMGQGDMLAAQKRFLLLDRNHDGKLSPLEIGGDN